MGKTRYNVIQFIDAIKGSGGIISTIAKRIGCDWHTAAKWIAEYPTVGKAYQDECERVNDMAVGILLKSIEGGNTQDAKWWLARKRKQEFGDAVDVTSAGEALKIVVEYADRDIDPAASA
jgi:hypothetical protein